MRFARRRRFPPRHNGSSARCRRPTPAPDLQVSVVTTTGRNVNILHELYSLQWRLPIDQSINWTMGKTRSVRTVPNNCLEMAAVKGGCIRLESA
uniref:Uncharacterized protein n=1 Tax=Globodera rostochiensis TaxID=31243 RepID=A0A914HZ92_GLORO